MAKHYGGLEYLNHDVTTNIMSAIRICLITPFHSGTSK